MTNTPGSPSRREFLCSLGVAGCAAVFVPVLQGCETAELHGATVSGAFPFDVTVAPYLPLAKAGGIVAVDFGGRPIVLIRVDDVELVALYRICTHAACDMDPNQFGQWHADTKQLECLCHQSYFKPDGSVVAGPAKLPLPKYAVTFDVATGKGSVQT